MKIQQNLFALIFYITPDIALTGKKILKNDINKNASWRSNQAFTIRCPLIFQQILACSPPFTEVKTQAPKFKILNSLARLFTLNSANKIMTNNKTL